MSSPALVIVPETLPVLYSGDEVERLTLPVNG